MHSHVGYLDGLDRFGTLAFGIRRGGKQGKGRGTAHSKLFFASTGDACLSGQRIDEKVHRSGVEHLLLLERDVEFDM